MKQKTNARSLKTFVAALAVAGTAMTPLSTVSAAADGWGHREGIRHVGGHCDLRDNPNCGGGVRGGDGRFHTKHFKKRRGGYYPPRVERRHHDDGSAAAAIILGITGAAIIAGALSNSNPSTVYETYPAPNAYPPAPSRGPKVITYGSTLEPWTRGWYEWCDDRYRSFNPETGTYRGYDNRDHFCVPK